MGILYLHNDIFMRPFVKRFALCYRTVICSVTLVYCDQTARWIKMKLGMQVGLGPGHIMLGGKPPPPPQRCTAPNFRPICCGQMSGWIKMPLCMEVGLGPGDFVLDGDPAPPPQKGAEPPLQFSAHVYCCQTAGCIKMPLGMEVDLGPGHMVLDGYPAPPPRERGGHSSPVFSAHVYCGHGRPSQLLLSSCSY